MGYTPRKHGPYEKLYGSFLYIGFNCLNAAQLLREDNLFLITKSLSPQEFPVIIQSTSEVWRAESTLKRPIGLEPQISELEIQHHNHLAIAPWYNILKNVTVVYCLTWKVFCGITREFVLSYAISNTIYLSIF